MMPVIFSYLQNKDSNPDLSMDTRKPHGRYGRQVQDAMIPQYLYHYYEKGRKPFLSITETDEIHARSITDKIGQSSVIFNRWDSPQKCEFYSYFRNYTEQTIKSMFVDKGGKPTIDFPRYMTLGPTNWFLFWYEETGIIEIPL